MTAVIDTRQELIIALRYAAELEHGLMVQYLYAAMTLKPPASPSLTDAQRALVSGWRTSIYEVARQEMGHLGTVQNILSAVGGGAWFRLPRFPIVSRYYTPSQTFSLAPLDLTTIERFVRFEAPLRPAFVAIEVAPDPLEYQSVGDLYGQIRSCMERIPEHELFIGDRDSQDTRSWSSSVEVHPIPSLERAVEAINDIVEEGEGTPTGGPESHYQRFLTIRSELKDELEASPGFVAHDNVAENPTVFEDGGPARYRITNPECLAVARLFNSVYTTMILSLCQYYKFQERTGVPFPDINPADALRSNIATGLMKGVIRPLGGLILPLMKCGDDASPHAGPPFEMYLDPVLPWGRRPSWVILTERLASEIAFLRDNEGIHPLLPGVRNALELIRRTVEELVGQ